MEERVEKLEKRVDRLEENERELLKHDRLMLAIMKDLVSHLAKMKHPATNFALVVSIIASTLINNLPVIVGLFFK